jgi:hypothetical protein
MLPGMENLLRPADIGRRGLVEGGERPRGGHWGRDVFNGHHPRLFA